MANEIVMTQEGYNDLVKELNELKTTRRAEISEKIRVARGFGDLSENSEYDEAKNEQGKLYSRRSSYSYSGKSAEKCKNRCKI